MNRRDLLKRMGLAALVLPSTKLIFDMGARKGTIEPMQLYVVDWSTEPITLEMIHKMYMQTRLYIVDHGIEYHYLSDGVLCRNIS